MIQRPRGTRDFTPQEMEARRHLESIFRQVAETHGSREIATLRALGFSPLPVVVGVFLESMLLSVAGGVVGGALAWLAFDGYRAATLNFQSFSQVAFAFAVTSVKVPSRLFW